LAESAMSAAARKAEAGVVGSAILLALAREAIG
jgi:hypothetical protein